MRCASSEEHWPAPTA
uniref:Uncharacterized protein n=1 Tax=Arundo donax TaxID=35708 RepID=A0A0A9EP74_ARUDO